jgi:hypothetical protein
MKSVGILSEELLGQERASFTDGLRHAITIENAFHLPDAFS